MHSRKSISCCLGPSAPFAVDPFVILLIEKLRLAFLSSNFTEHHFALNLL